MLPFFTFALNIEKKRERNQKQSQKIVLNDSIRQYAPGKFILLQHGYVHYNLSGPDTAKTVVLVHGILASSFIWDKTVSDLCNAGFRVLSFDLYGRGYSDRPSLAYDEITYYLQLCELLDSLKINSKIDLVGTSMGGAIAIIFAEQQPERVEKLCLIDPAGGNIPRPLALLFALKVPILKKAMQSIKGTVFVNLAYRKSFFDNQLAKELKPQLNNELQYEGYTNAVFKTIKNFNFYDQRDCIEELSDKGENVMLIWGRKDRVVPYRKSKCFLRYLPEASLVGIKKAGHIPQYEKSEIVNPLLINFLR